MEKQQAKEAEHDAKQRAVKYTMRVTDMLNNVGEVDKGNFRSGSEGAVVRTGKGRRNGSEGDAW